MRMQFRPDWAVYDWMHTCRPNYKKKQKKNKKYKTVTDVLNLGLHLSTFCALLVSSALKWTFIFIERQLLTAFKNNLNLPLMYVCKTYGWWHTYIFRWHKDQFCDRHGTQKLTEQKAGLWRSRLSFLFGWFKICAKKASKSSHGDWCQYGWLVRCTETNSNAFWLCFKNMVSCVIDIVWCCLMWSDAVISHTWSSTLVCLL